MHTSIEKHLNPLPSPPWAPTDTKTGTHKQERHQHRQTCADASLVNVARSVAHGGVAGEGC